MSSYRTETQQLSAQFVNSSFVRKLDEGRTKEAAAEGTAFIRELVRQESYAREIIAPVLLQDDEVDRDEHTDEPKKIIEKEPGSEATFVNFAGAGPRTWFKGPRYAVYFGKVESQHFTKSKFQLMTYVNDIRKILADNSVKDLSDQEDLKFQATIDEIVERTVAADGILAATSTGYGATVSTGIVNGAQLQLSTSKYNLEASQLHAAPQFNASAFKRGFQKMVHNRRPIGKMTMTKELFYEALDLRADVIGNDVASRHYTDGVETEEKLFGIPVITTIKSHIHKKNRVYIYAPENFLGNFFLLQDATLFIKQEADVISFWTYAAPGIGIGNTKSVQAIQFLDGTSGSDSSDGVFESVNTDGAVYVSA
jgi:hypothetical protein